jgi:hypothetical protein
VSTTEAGQRPCVSPCCLLQYEQSLGWNQHDNNYIAYQFFYARLLQVRSAVVDACKMPAAAECAHVQR